MTLVRAAGFPMRLSHGGHTRQVAYSLRILFQRSFLLDYPFLWWSNYDVSLDNRFTSWFEVASLRVASTTAETLGNAPYHGEARTGFSLRAS